MSPGWDVSTSGNIKVLIMEQPNTLVKEVFSSLATKKSPFLKYFLNRYSVNQAIFSGENKILHFTLDGKCCSDWNIPFVGKLAVINIWNFLLCTFNAYSGWQQFSYKFQMQLQKWSPAVKKPNDNGVFPFFSKMS